MSVYTHRKNEISGFCSRPWRHTLKSKCTGKYCSCLITLKILINNPRMFDMKKLCHNISWKYFKIFLGKVICLRANTWVWELSQTKHHWGVKPDCFFLSDRYTASLKRDVMCQRNYWVHSHKYLWQHDTSSTLWVGISNTGAKADYPVKEPYQSLQGGQRFWTEKWESQPLMLYIKLLLIWVTWGAAEGLFNSTKENILSAF